MNTEENEQQELKAEKDLNDITLALDVHGSEEFSLDTKARYVIADTGVPTSPEESQFIAEDATLGFEIVTTASLPTEERVQKDSKGNNKVITVFMYNGVAIMPTIKALIVDRSKPLETKVAVEGKPTSIAYNFKGMREGEQITPDIIAKRFSKQVPFTVSFTPEGRLSVSNPDEVKKVTVLGFGEAAKIPTEAESTDAYERAIAAAKTATDIEAIEARVDAHTDEMVHELEAEVKEPLSVEEIKEIGDEGLNAAEVEDPEDSEESDVAPETQIENDDRVAQIHNMYERNVLDIRLNSVEEVSRFVGRLEESESSLSVAPRALIQEANDSISRLSVVIRGYGDYPLPAVQTEIRQAIEALRGVQGSVLRFGQETLTDIHTGIGALERTLVEHSLESENRDADFEAVTAQEGIEIKEGTVSATSILREASDTLEGTQQLRSNLNVLDTVLGELSQTMLRRQIGRLEEILQDSYSRPVDLTELVSITQTIRQGFEDGELRSVLTETDASLQTVISQARRALTVLNPAS